jgi:hypothetical protein
MTDRKELADIDYGYVDRMVANIRNSLMITQAELPYEKGVLLSIHLQSNRPDNFTQFLDDLEASIDDPSNIEVVVKIDDVDAPMNELLPKEVARRPFVVKYISTPLDGGFFELWRSMNDILDVSDPNAYFLWNMNDEMAVLNKGWDTALKKYVGLFPDHIFRLRTSLFRARNYCDFWENGFAPETSAITTRRWIEIGGNWNPCLGPDSFQQCVAYYFAHHDRFNKFKPLREMPIHDMTFKGEGAFLGLEGDKLWKRVRGATKAWYRLMSHEIQTEASRRAQKLHAHICAGNNQLDSFSVTDDLHNQKIVLTDNEEQKVIREFPYRLSKVRIRLTNALRGPYYLYYAGGGQQARWPFVISLIKYVSLRYDCLEWIYYASKSYSHHKPRVHIAFNQKCKAVALGVARMFTYIPDTVSRVMSVSPAPVRVIGMQIGKMLAPLFQVLKTVTSRLGKKLFPRLNRGYPLSLLFAPGGSVMSGIEWQKIDAVLAHVILPERYKSKHYRRAALRFLFLKHWYQISPEQLLEAAEKHIEWRYHIGLPRNAPLPCLKAIYLLERFIDNAGQLEKFYQVARQEIDFGKLPAFNSGQKNHDKRLVA